MKFDTYLPCEQLRPYLKSLAISEDETEKSYRVLPETGLVIGFQYRGRLSLVQGDAALALASSGLTGLNDSYRLFKSSANIGTVLVYFKETGASAFFRQPLHELFGESISLDQFMLRSELLLLEEQLAEAQSDLQRIKVVEDFLIGRLTNISPDPLVAQAVALIYRHHGNLRMEDLANWLHTSQSPLEKRFRKTVGATPKKFANIVRFKHILTQRQHHPSLTQLGYELGFYDQSHFIKAFRNFTGEAPENFFNSI